MVRFALPVLLALAWALPARAADPAECLKPRRAPAAGPARSDQPKELGRVTFVAAGDVLPHVSVKLSAEAAAQKDEKGQSTNNEGYDALFAPVADLVRQSDYGIANLETPVSPSGDKGTVEFHFNAPRALLAGLKAAGFNVLSFANNHVYDQGRRGLTETMDELDKAGIPFYGAGRNRDEAVKGLRLTKNGVTVALLAASQFFNQSQHDLKDPKQARCNKTDDPAAMVEAVKAAREDSDFVIVSLHWGVEYQPKPRESEVKLAHELFEAGADVILGTHPHVLQPLEVYRAADGRTCLVVYSLGNFISNQSRQYAHGVSPEKVGDTRDTALLRFSVVKRDWGSGAVQADLAEVSFLPAWTENDRVKKDGKERIAIRTVSLERALAAARADVDAAVAKLPEKPSRAERAALVALKKKAAHYERRRAIIEGRLGADFAADHAP